MSWNDTDHSASIAGIVSFATQTAVIVSAGLHIWAYKDGFEIAYRPLRPIKERLDDVVSMLDRLDDEDKRRIRECCEASHDSLGELRKRHKRLAVEFKRLKCERCERGAIGLHLGNMVSYVFSTKDEVNHMRRLAERLHRDTMRTTTIYTRSQDPEQRSNELDTGDAPELTAVRVESLNSDAETLSFQSQQPAADDLEEDLTSVPLRAFFLFDDVEDSCSDKEVGTLHGSEETVC
ncbi:unnamed protein product [Peniophora sp. CBMAI 1063]|nr:unnamed protein product [Peniophora sp. CBMAI 1063]